jgi:hypothetical protein
MTEAYALEIVYGNLLGELSIPALLRNGEGLDQAKFRQTVSALEFLAHQYVNREVVPKKLALCMVDIYGAFDFRSSIYPDKAVRNQIEDAGIEIQNLALTLFSELEK